MARHQIDAKEIGGFDHVRALRRVGEAAALPKVATFEQQRSAWPRFSPQPIDQRLEMSEPTHAPESVSRLGKIETREGMGGPASGRNPELLEKCMADKMRRMPSHAGDTDIDTGLAEMDRQELCMGICQMHQPDIAETADIVQVVFGRLASPGQPSGSGRSGQTV